MHVARHWADLKGLCSWVVKRKVRTVCSLDAAVGEGSPHWHAALKVLRVFGCENWQAAAQASGGTALELQLRCYHRCIIMLAPGDASPADPGDQKAAAGGAAAGAQAAASNPAPDPEPGSSGRLWAALAARLGAMEGVWLPDGFGSGPGGPRAGAPARPAAEAPCAWVRLGALGGAVRAALAVAGGKAAPD